MMQNQFRCFALHKNNISDDKNIGVFAKHLIVDVTPKTINQIYCGFFDLVLVLTSTQKSDTLLQEDTTPLVCD